MLKLTIFLAALFVVGFCQSNLPCPAGWRHLVEYGKCLIPTPTEMTWHEAEAYCEKYGATLMSVNAVEEYLRVFEMLNLNIWIGLYKSVNEKENTWRFANNETVHFVAWGYTGTSNCARLYSNRLHTTEHCEVKYHGMCQVYATA